MPNQVIRVGVCVRVVSWRAGRDVTRLVKLYSVRTAPVLKRRDQAFW